jgi:hemolysin activation/secretion protein
VYVPLLANGTHLAMRAGGALATGDVPVQYAPTVGGWRTLRGYSWNRYAGDAAVDGGTELHVPVGTAKLFMRWNVGVFGLADVGRVWFDGRSDGGWHTGVGGGLSLMAFDKSISLAYAHGEVHRFYLKLGMH